MDKKLIKDVHDELASALKSSWPQFERVSGVIKGEALASGWQVFRWRADEEVWFFVTLVIGSFNSFEFRFMWSDNPEYPKDDTTYPFFQNNPAQIPGSHRLDTKTRAGGSWPKEWKVGVNPAFVPGVVVPAAIAELKTAIDPIMRKVLKNHGSQGREGEEIEQSR